MVCEECGQDGLGIDLATAVCAKAFITYMRVTVPASNVLAAGVFGIGVFH
jgi:hypothetical protein